MSESGFITGRGSWRRLLEGLGPFVGLIFVFTLFVLISPPEFHALYNLKTILTQTVIIGIGALGMTFIIISGGIDLSVGSIVALAGVTIAVLMKAVVGGEDVGLGLTLLASLAGVGLCALVGLVNGALIAYLRIAPFIVTLGMMQIVRGLTKGMANQTTVVTGHNWLGQLMTVEPQIDVWYSVAPGVWLMLVLAVMAMVVLKSTVFGRYVVALGSNEATARLCGIKVARMKMFIYAVGGALTGVAGVMQFSNLNLGDPTAAGGMELDIIAAVVIGGGSLSGGEGSALGSIIGAIIMAIMRNGCTLVGIPNYVQNIVIGTIIIVAVGLDRLKHM
jgi:ribose/xylose/arabinose/galactoside ABC-type transport system permease subunit